MCFLVLGAADHISAQCVPEVNNPDVLAVDFVSDAQIRCSSYSILNNWRYSIPL